MSKKDFYNRVGEFSVARSGEYSSPIDSLNLENCIPYAKKRLSKYGFAKVIEGNSGIYLKSLTKTKKNAAFFVDGPKGLRMYSLFKLIIKKFPKFQFIGIHDCNKENGSRNRYHVNNFFGKEFPILYSDTPFQEKYSHLNKSLINTSKLSWRPYYFDGKPLESYGFETGYVINHYKEHVKAFEKFQYGLTRYWRINLKPKLTSIILRVRS